MLTSGRQTRESRGPNYSPSAAHAVEQIHPQQRLVEEGQSAPGSHASKFAAAAAASPPSPALWAGPRVAQCVSGWASRSQTTLSQPCTLQRWRPPWSCWCSPWPLQHLAQFHAEQQMPLLHPSRHDHALKKNAMSAMTAPHSDSTSSRQGHGCWM